MNNIPEFDELRREYLQGAVDRASHLREQVAQLRQGGPVDLKALRQEVHKLRGSAGFYGFKALSAAAAAAEDTMILVLDGELDRDDRQIADLVDGVIAAIDEAVN